MTQIQLFVNNIIFKAKVDDSTIVSAMENAIPAREAIEDTTLQQIAKVG